MAQYLNLAGVEALWAKIKNTFALKSHTHSYLPLSGGTLTGNLALSNSYLQLWSDSKLYGFNVSASSGEPIYLKNDAWYALIHSGNIGSQSVANADTLDGYHASNFMSFTNHGDSYVGARFLNSDLSQLAHSKYIEFWGGDWFNSMWGEVTAINGFVGNLTGNASTAGTATSANKLNTNAGSATKPVYFNGGVPVACTYSLNKTVPADAVFTDTNTTYSAGTGLSLSSTTFSVKYGSSAGTACQGDDSRLSNSRPASDVYAWAKAATKPTYTAAEVGAVSDTYGDGYIMKYHKIDASSLDINTYYPVTMPIGACPNVRIEIRNSLNSNVPSWSVHSRGFSTRKIWEVNGAGWGVNPVNRRILVSDYTFSSSDPVRGIEHMHNSSHEVVYVRGGGIYHFYLSHGVTPTLRTSTFVGTDEPYYQAVSPTTTAPSEICANISYSNHTHTSFANSITVTGSVSASSGFYQSSDERLKDFQDDIQVDFEKLSKLRKKYFTWKTDEDKKLEIGVSAQEIQKIYPEIVSTDSEGYLNVAYDKLSVIALAAIDELKRENNDLKDQLKAIKDVLKEKGIL